MKTEIAELLLPSSRRDAITHGFDLYFTGVPCFWRHVAPRRVSGDCLECHRWAQKARYKERVARRRAAL